MALTSNADRVWLAHGDQVDLTQTSTRWIAVSRGPQFRPNLASLDQETFTVLEALSAEPCIAAVNEHLAEDNDLEKLPEQVAKALHIAFANDWVADARVRNQEAGAN